MPINKERPSHGTPESRSLRSGSLLPLPDTTPLQDLIDYGTKQKTIPTEKQAYPLTEKANVQTPDAFHLMVVSNVLYGTKHCDVETFEKHMNIARSLENTKVLFLGPLISHRTRTDVVSPEEQVDYMQGWISRLDAEDKILGAVRADYPKAPARSENRMDDVNDVLFNDVSFPVLQNGGILEITVSGTPKDEDDEPAKQVYTIGGFSKHGASKAATNKNASAKRAFLEKLGGSVDVAIVANPYAADVTQTMAGHLPTRKNLTLITAGGYSGNTTGERPELTDIDARDKFAVDGEPSGQVLTLYSRTKDTRVHLDTSHFVYDYFVDMVDNGLKAVEDSGKMKNLYTGLRRKGIIFSPADKQTLAQRSTLVPNLLAEQT